MWSAIPIALLCMIVNLSEGKQGSGPEGDLRPERTDFSPTRVDFRPERAWGNELTVRRTDGQMDGRNDKQEFPCVLQDFIPFGAASLLPLTPIHNHAKQDNGYR